MTDHGASPAATPNYSLDELTERSGVTVRTVRYYIAEGLLPPPAGAGPRSSYSDVHLKRLLLISRLKEAYLPLREIRRQLQAMSDDQIARAVDEPAPTGADDARAPLRRVLYADARPAGVPVESASAYLDRVMHDEREAAPAPDRTPFQLPGASPRAHVNLPHTVPPPIDPVPAPGYETSWKRISVAAEAELLIEADAYERRRAQIDSAVAWLRRILAGS